MNPTPSSTKWLWLVPGLLVSCWYFWLTSQGQSVGFTWDDAEYLLLADFLSPFLEYKPDIVAQTLRTSPFPLAFPAVLAIFGAGSQSILAAHIVHTSLVLLAGVVFFFVAYSEFRSYLVSGLLSVSFLLAPTTVLHSMDIWSENLYLFLSLCIVFLAQRAQYKPRLVILAAALLGILVTTRTVGFALVLAFVFWVGVSVREYRWPALATALVSTALLVVANGLIGDSPGYVTDYLSRAADFSLLEYLKAKYFLLTAAWHNSFTYRPDKFSSVGTGIALVCVASGLVIRIFQKRLDAFYLLIYLAVIIFWRYTDNAERFLYAVLPFLLLAGTSFFWALANYLNSSALRHSLRAAFPVAMVLVLIPSWFFLWQRYSIEVPEELEAYTHTSSWLKMPANRVVGEARFRRDLLENIRGLPGRVPDGECVYTIHRVWPMCMPGSTLWYLPTRIAAANFCAAIARSVATIT